MILWAEGKAVGMPCNQRVEFIEVIGGMLRVKLCGSGDLALIAPGETCGVEFNDSLEVFYTPTLTRWTSATSPNAST